MGEDQEPQVKDEAQSAEGDEDVWAGFIRAAEAIVGVVDDDQATTADEAERVRSKIEAAVTVSLKDRLGADCPDGVPAVLKMYEELGESVTGCGRKSTVVRACIGGILATVVSIPAASEALALLWTEFPGGAAQLLEALGTDVANPDTEATARVEGLIEFIGHKKRRLKEIHELLCRCAQLVGGTAGVNEALEYVRAMSDQEAVAELMSFCGIGSKLAGCILAFTCLRPLLAVDTNVGQMATLLGWFTLRKEQEMGPETYHDIFFGLNGLQHLSKKGRAKGGGRMRVEATKGGALKKVVRTRLVVPAQHRRALHCLLLQLNQKRAGNGHRTENSTRQVNELIRIWKPRFAQLKPTFMLS